MKLPGIMRNAAGRIPTLFTKQTKEQRSSDPEQLIVSRIGDSVNKAILEALIYSPGATEKELIGLIKTREDSVSAHLHQLLTDGILSTEGERYFIAEIVKPALMKLLPRNYQCPGMLREYGDQR